MSLEGSFSTSPQVVAAGGVVYRQSDGKTEVVLCGRQEERIWSLPKGTPNLGESLLETALREVREETGLEVRAGEKIGTISYSFPRKGVLLHKTVHHYLMEPLGGSLEQHDTEYDLVQWFTAEEACNTLTYPNEKKIVRRALSMLPQGGNSC